MVLAADFGGANTDGLLQYMRLRDRNDLYLMSGFVGKEWQAVLAGGHRDQAPPAAAAGAAADRRGGGGRDLRTRQVLSLRARRQRGVAFAPARAGRRSEHASCADPAQSERIAQALAAFSRTLIERSVAYGAPGDAYGLVDPAAVIVLFTNDQARPPLDFAVGDLASDGLGRYVLMPDHTEIVTIPDDQITSLMDFAARLAR